MPSPSCGTQAEGRLFGYNGSGRAPGGLTIEAVRAAGHTTMPERGPLTINVPGAVDAWSALLDRFGRHSLADAVAAAAHVAEHGYELTAINTRSITAGTADIRRGGDGHLRVRRAGRDALPAAAARRDASSVG